MNTIKLRNNIFLLFFCFNTNLLFAQKIKIVTINDSSMVIEFQGAMKAFPRVSINSFSPDSSHFGILDYENRVANIYDSYGHIINQIDFYGNDISVSNSGKSVLIEYLVSENLRRRSRLQFYNDKGVMTKDTIFNGGLTTRFTQKDELFISQSADPSGIRLPNGSSNLLILSTNNKIMYDKVIPYCIILNKEIKFDPIKREYELIISKSLEEEVRYEKIRLSENLEIVN